MITLKAKIIILLLAILLFIYVFNLILKRRMRIEHSILWLMVCLVIVIMTLWQNFATGLALLVGIYYPPSLYFALAILFTLMMLFFCSVEISQLKEQNKTLNQEMAIIRSLLNDYEAKESKKEVSP